MAFLQFLYKSRGTARRLRRWRGHNTRCRVPGKVALSNLSFRPDPGDVKFLFIYVLQQHVRGARCCSCTLLHPGAGAGGWSCSIGPLVRAAAARTDEEARSCTCACLHPRPGRLLSFRPDSGDVKFLFIYVLQQHGRGPARTRRPDPAPAPACLHRGGGGRPGSGTSDSPWFRK